MKAYLVIPRAPVRIPGVPPVSSRSAYRFALRWTDHHPSSHYGIGVLLDIRGEQFDGHQFRHLRDSVGAWMESDDIDRVRGALGLPPGERIEKS